jgi:hypothetical protein
MSWKLVVCGDAMADAVPEKTWYRWRRVSTIVPVIVGNRHRSDGCDWTARDMGWGAVGSRYRLNGALGLAAQRDVFERRSDREDIEFAALWDAGRGGVESAR